MSNSCRAIEHANPGTHFKGDAHPTHPAAAAMPPPATSAAPAKPPNAMTPRPATAAPVMIPPVLIAPPASSPLRLATAATREETGRALLPTIVSIDRADSKRSAHRRFLAAPGASVSVRGGLHSKQKSSPQAAQAQWSASPSSCAWRQLLHVNSQRDTTMLCAAVGQRGAE